MEFIEFYDQIYSPANDINKAAPLFVQKSWSLEPVVLTPGFIGNVTVNMKDGFYLTPVRIGYIYVGHVYVFWPFLAFCFPYIKVGLNWMIGIL